MYWINQRQTCCSKSAYMCIYIYIYIYIEMLYLRVYSCDLTFINFILDVNRYKRILFKEIVYKIYNTSNNIWYNQQNYKLHWCSDKYFMETMNLIINHCRFSVWCYTTTKILKFREKYFIVHCKGCNPLLIPKFMGPTWSPPGADRTQLGPMWATWTFLFGMSPGTK